MGGNRYYTHCNTYNRTHYIMKFTNLGITITTARKISCDEIIVYIERRHKQNVIVGGSEGSNNRYDYRAHQV